MMGRQTGVQSQLFYLFNLEERIPDSISYAGSIESCCRCWLTCARNWLSSIARSVGLRSIPSS